MTKAKAERKLRWMLEPVYCDACAPDAGTDVDDLRRWANVEPSQSLIFGRKRADRQTADWQEG